MNTIDTVLLVHYVYGSDPQTGVCLLVLDRFLVALSPLLLKYDLHRPLRMLHHGRFDLDFFCRDDGITAHGEFARAYFVDLGQREDVADTYILETRDGEKIARCKQVFSTSN